MGWVDRQKRHGAVLALIALALQIVLSLDHVHLHGVTQNVAHATTAQSVVLTQKKLQTPAPSPADDDGYCAICASIFLASTAFAPVPPPVPMPANFQRLDDCFNSTRQLAESLRLAFRSRAPPTA